MTIMILFVTYETRTFTFILKLTFNLNPKISKFHKSQEKL